MPEYFVSTDCCFQAEVEMEQIRSLLQQEVETRTQKIVTAKKEGQSEESLPQLYDQAQFFAEKLSKLEQSAVTSHEGMSCPPV